MLSLDGPLSPVMSSMAGKHAVVSGDTQLRATLQQNQVHHRHMWIITGPAGCGKSSIAEYLAKELSLPYIEGDDVSISTTLIVRTADMTTTVPHLYQQTENGSRRSPDRRRPLGLAHQPPRSRRGPPVSLRLLSNQSAHRSRRHLLRPPTKVPRRYSRGCLQRPQCGRAFCVLAS